MIDGRHPLELRPEQLRRATDPAALGFETTRELPAPPHMVGQSRAQEAIDFALEMPDIRHNLYVAGPPGTGRQTAVRVAVERVARERPPARDWLYVHNFERPDEPRAVAVPAGQGRAFARDVDALAQGCRRALRRAFGGEAYASRRADLLRDLAARHRALLDGIEAEARQFGVMVDCAKGDIVPLRPIDPAAPGGAAGAPAPLSREEFEALPAATRERIEADRARARAALDRELPRIRALEEEARARVRGLDREVAEAAARPPVDELAARYAASADAVEFLRALVADVVANAERLRGGEGVVADLASAPDDLEGSEGDDHEGGLDGILRRYRVNVLVAHRADDPAPVVYETNPTRANLVGRIEADQRHAAPHADHLMIRPGALHRANGGFLILHAPDLAPAAWEALKRAVRSESISLDADGSESAGGPGVAAPRPEAITVAVRVILIGEHSLYAALLEHDAEFRQLFKVLAEFEEEMPRSPEGELAYAHYTGGVARSSGGPPLAAEAVALLIEEGSRWVEDQEKLSTLFGELRDLTLEACHRAKKERAAAVTRVHVARAIVARERRLGLYSDRLDERFLRGTVAIETGGAVVGQINALSVNTVNDFSFGRPSRITARTSPGRAGLIDIEREVARAGADHSKGVLILNGYLNGRFAQEFPPSLTASLCFEQAHSEVDGDSASTAELLALLSSLAGVPLKQPLAITGAVTQRGEVLAVGGVTHKVEGFFRVCRARGLTGEQGVLLPRANARDLMLRDDVVEAARAGRFHLYAIATVDEALELLTGMPAGRPDAAGRFPEGSVNARIHATLRAYAERVRTISLAPTAPVAAPIPGRRR